MGTVLITGANGFVGRALCERVLEEGWKVRAAVRPFDVGGIFSDNVEVFNIKDIGPDTDWSDALVGVDTIVHLAARVHMMNDTMVNPLAEYRRVNVYGTKRLAMMAEKARVKKIVFVSSIKVNGEASIDKPYSEDDEPNPEDPYGVSKLEAEQVIRGIHKKGEMDTVIIRSPLMYGPGVKGNFLKLINLVDSGIPLPFKNIRNKRSFIFLDNMIDLIYRCMVEAKASGELFMASDGEDLSTPDLIRRLAFALGRHARLFSFPLGALLAAGRLMGKGDAIRRLTGNLQVDISRVEQILHWRPTISVSEGLKRTANWCLYDNN